ncbi:MAG: DUF192 domain-containing protein [Nanoarchaeota archaeon]|nr:DUF192 domain-containing protein [Nanoarchaeota archaeon]
MQITIKKGNKAIGKARCCNTALSRAFGLMMRKEQMALIELPYESRALSGIHTFLMLFTLDIYWLDKRMKVVAVKKGLKPCRYANAPKPAKYVLEAPSGFLKLKIGDRIAVPKD